MVMLLPHTTQSQASQPNITIGHYQIKESGIVARSQSDRGLYWLDDHTVLAIGFLSKRKNENFTGDDKTFRLLVWNTISNEIVVEPEIREVGGLCVAPGYVRYQFERDGEQYVRFGTYGRTREKVLDIQAMKDGILAVSPVSCREYNPKLLRLRYGQWSLPLLAPGEYLDRADIHDVSWMRYFPEDGSEPIDLTEIPKRDVERVPRYSRVLGRYVFAELRRRVAKDEEQRFWLLDRRGRVEAFTIPAGPWMTGTTDAMPARAAWVLMSKAIGLRGGYGAAGLYVLRGAEVERVVGGYPHAISVAPSGCGVAVAIDVSGRSDESRPMIMAIDICKRGK
jgi:hypothetical protein